MAGAMIIIVAVMVVVVVVAVMMVRIVMAVVVIGLGWCDRRPKDRHGGQEDEKGFHCGASRRRPGQRAGGRVELHPKVFSED
jgi:hypothetical protein